VVAARVSVVVGATGVIVMATQHPSQSATRTTEPRHSVECRRDPSSAIAALPPGAVFDGNGACFTLRNGLEITTPDVTVENATFNDRLRGERSDGGVKPIVQIKDSAGVTLSNLVLNGRNFTGRFHANLVGQEGVQVLSSASVSLTNITTNYTFGDGLTLGFQPGHPASTNITVNGYTVNHAGRQGITLAYAVNSTLNDVTVNASADAGWDFESDLTGVGSGNLTINRPGGHKGFLFQGTLTGPITVNSPRFSGDVAVVRSSAASGQPITFNSGTILVRNRFSGPIQAGITVDGPGDLAFNSVAIGRQPAVTPPTGPAWAALDGADITFARCLLTPPLGVKDGASTVTVTLSVSGIGGSGLTDFPGSRPKRSTGSQRRQVLKAE
jgi:hypothetical protein